MQNPHAGGSIYIWTLGNHKTAHVIARDFGHEDVYRLLMDRSPDDLKLAVACEIADEPLVASIVRNHPTLTPESQRQLVYIAQNHNTRAAVLMLNAGWPVDVRAARGQTALHWAGFHGNLELAQELLKRRAPVDVRELEFDGTPLNWTLHGSRHSWQRRTGRYAAVVEALLAAGSSLPREWESADLPESLRIVLRRYSKS